MLGMETMAPFSLSDIPLQKLHIQWLESQQPQVSLACLFQHRIPTPQAKERAIRVLVFSVVLWAQYGLHPINDGEAEGVSISQPHSPGT